MKTKILILTIALLSSGLARAGFNCEEHGGDGLSVLAEHENLAFGIGEVPGKVSILISKNDKIQMSAEVVHGSTRIGSYYSYKFPVDDVYFSISESALVVSNPGCKPGGRMTCDYDWVSTYKANLFLNGKTHELECAVN